MATQTTLLKLFDRHIEGMKQRIGVDRSPRTLPNHIYARGAVAEFIKKKFNASDLAFGQLSEQFIRDFQDFVLQDKGLAVDGFKNKILSKIMAFTMIQLINKLNNRNINNLKTSID
ncbi:hypothetical protein EZS27_023413 [termite gut metagenome]|uniref:Phage integrase SAM-like domain-containing protein n=1 Tax=termite gut metagenome TaxID=433724 RepID=A0A5J4R122_9ZZZZ